MMAEFWELCGSILSSLVRDETLFQDLAPLNQFIDRCTGSQPT